MRIPFREPTRHLRQFILLTASHYLLPSITAQPSIAGNEILTVSIHHRAEIRKWRPRFYAARYVSGRRRGSSTGSKRTIRACTCSRISWIGRKQQWRGPAASCGAGQYGSVGTSSDGPCCGRRTFTKEAWRNSGWWATSTSMCGTRPRPSGHTCLLKFPAICRRTSLSKWPKIRPGLPCFPLFSTASLSPSMRGAPNNRPVWWRVSSARTKQSCSRLSLGVGHRTCIYFNLRLFDGVDVYSCAVREGKWWKIGSSVASNEWRRLVKDYTCATCAEPVWMVIWLRIVRTLWGSAVSWRSLPLLRPIARLLLATRVKKDFGRNQLLKFWRN